MGSGGGWGSLRGLFFAAPAVLVTGLLIVYPIISVVYMSLIQQGWDGVTSFVWFENYRELFQSYMFPTVMRNTIVWTVGTVAAAFLVGFAAAFLINQKFVKLKAFWRSILMLPWVVPQVVTAIAWKWLYSSDFGMWNHLLIQAGLIKAPISWLTRPELVLIAVGIIQVWAAAPFAMLMLSAGLQAMPSDLYEAAELDGASKFAQIRYIVLPALANIIFITLLIEIVWSLNAFTLIWVVTQGGPAGRSRILSLQIYDSFRSFNFNAASATAVLQLMICLVFAASYIFFQVRSDD